jgi:hypothetical protein
MVLWLFIAIWGQRYAKKVKLARFFGEKKAITEGILYAIYE